MPTTAHFATQIYRVRLPRAAALNRDLTEEIATLARIDDAGRAWSRENYVNGYSSYASMPQLHRTSPNFGELHDRIEPHLRAFVKTLGWTAKVRPRMTTCWANQMGRGSYHTLHLHPLSLISGVYYVTTPDAASPFKIEDPRMPLFMNSPARPHYLKIKPKAGDLILFESWLRHEVPPNRAKEKRLSVSFNWEG